jgi:hypothetical protein
MPMFRRIAAPALWLAAACLGAADVPSTETPPWSASFSTEVRGAERQFVATPDQRTWLLLATADAPAIAGFAGQEVAIAGKLRRLADGRWGLYRFDRLVLDGDAKLLAGRLDGDNVWCTGSLRSTPQGQLLTLHAATAAPSDQAVVARRSAGIAADDWDGRRAVVTWAYEQAKHEGSPDGWGTIADGLLTRLVEDLAAAAAAKRDPELLHRAIGIATTDLHDPGLAAKVSTAEWLKQAGGAEWERLSRRLRAMGYENYGGRWLPRPDALAREFDDRLAAIPWKDADALYKLGRWADANAEFLPQARERSWRCYTAGNRADPSHVGICRELGIAPVISGEVKAASDFLDAARGIKIIPPAGWRHPDRPLEGDACWLDPTSDTAYLAIRAIAPPVEREALWRTLAESAQASAAFEHLGEDHPGTSDGEHQAVRLQYRWNDGKELRYAAVALISSTQPDRAAIQITAKGSANDQEGLKRAVEALITGTTISQPPAETKP